jgi:nitrite reductase/ring-hydroxylating ferredoxin subunit
MKADRRTFLGWIHRGALGLGASGLVLITGKFVRPLHVRDLSQEICVGTWQDLPVGSSKYLPDEDIYIFHEVEGIYALSGKCTHLGCSILRHPEGFACPCHGARFDLKGAPLSGPAPRPLTWHLISVDPEKRIWLHLDRTVNVGTCIRI